MKDILVIGDSCRDIFVYCDTNRLCPDVPVPVLNVLDQTENFGMAKNVQRNILTKIDSCDIITNKNWQYVTKTRYVHQKTNHTFFRVDTLHKIKPINLDDIEYENYKLIVISDYDKGFLSEMDIETICNNHKNVFIDTKKILGPWINNAKFIKINEHEYGRSKDFITKDIQDKIIQTLGGDGCIFQKTRYKVKEVEVKDSTGAGDSFMAALVIDYVKTGDIIKSIEYANFCASEVVKHKGVTLI
jgi:bifunctional ADP-heptose synthase (sugar kinase/adenylyltransferase)